MEFNKNSRTFRRVVSYLAAFFLMTLAFYIMEKVDNGQVVAIAFIFLVEESLEFAIKKFSDYEGHQSLTQMLVSTTKKVSAVKLIYVTAL